MGEHQMIYSILSPVLYLDGGVKGEGRGASDSSRYQIGDQRHRLGIFMGLSDSYQKCHLNPVKYNCST
jgi:hypothetical protein